jgi:hypothetical protein
MQVHAVNQAWAGHPGRQVANNPAYQVWAKHISPTEQAVLVFSTADTAVDATIDLTKLGLPATVNARDL